MKQLIICLLCLLWFFDANAQRQALREFNGKAINLTQVGIGSGYIDVALNFGDDSGLQDGLNITAGQDNLYFNDGTQGYYLPILTVLTPGFSSVVVRVNVTGLPIGSIFGTGAISKPTDTFKFFPYVSGIGDQENQVRSEDFIHAVDSILKLRLPDRYAGVAGTYPSTTPASTESYIAQNSAGEIYYWNGTDWVLFGVQFLQVGLFSPLPAIEAKGSLLLATYDVNGSKNLYISDGNNWVDAGPFLDTLNVNTININNRAVTGTKINQMGATTGQVIKWTGSTWAPANDAGGGGATLSDGDYGDIDVTGGGSFVTVDTGVINYIKLAINCIDSTKVINGGLSLNDLGQTGASTNYVIRWNGTKWIPSAETVVITDFTTTGLGNPPAVTATGKAGQTYRNMSTGELWRSDGTSWTIVGGTTIALTTTGTSGVATLVGSTLNVPNYTLAGLGGISLTSLSATTPLSYNNTTGVFTISQATTSTNGYLSSTDWNTFNSKQGALTLTTTGTSGAATLIGNTLNIPSYSGGGSGITALTGDVTASGTGSVASTIPASRITSSMIRDSTITTQDVKDLNITLSKLAGNSIDSNKVINKSLSLNDFSATGANANDVITWDGTKWAPAGAAGGSSSAPLNEFIYGTGSGITTNKAIRLFPTTIFGKTANVLAIGDTTTAGDRTLEGLQFRNKWGGANAEYRGDDYQPLIFKSPTGTSESADFLFRQSTATNQGYPGGCINCGGTSPVDSTRNEVMAWGFNINGAQKPTLHGIHYALEPSWYTGGSLYTEAHLEMYLPGFTSAPFIAQFGTGKQFPRLYSAQVKDIKNPLLTNSDWEFTCDEFYWNALKSRFTYGVMRHSDINNTADFSLAASANYGIQINADSTNNYFAITNISSSGNKALSNFTILGFRQYGITDYLGRSIFSTVAYPTYNQIDIGTTSTASLINIQTNLIANGTGLTVKSDLNTSTGLTSKGQLFISSTTNQSVIGMRSDINMAYWGNTGSTAIRAAAFQVGPNAGASLPSHEALQVLSNAVNTKPLQLLQTLTDSIRLFVVASDPEGVVTGKPGDKAFGSNGYSYTKRTGTGNTGWLADLCLGDVAGGGGGITGSGTATRLAFWSGSSALSSTSNLFWDNTNNRLGITTSTPLSRLDLGSTTSDLILAVYDNGVGTSKYGLGMATNSLKMSLGGTTSGKLEFGSWATSSFVSTGYINPSLGTILLSSNTSTDALGLTTAPFVKFDDANGNIFSVSTNSNQPFIGVTNGTVKAFGAAITTADAAYGTFSNHSVTIRTNNTARFVISNGGLIKFSTYGTGGNTGTFASAAGFDATGNIIEYSPAVVVNSTAVLQETKTSVTGTALTFTGSIVAGTDVSRIEIFKNGVLMELTTDYTLSSTTPLTLTLVTAAVSTDRFRFKVH